MVLVFAHHPIVAIARKAPQHSRDSSIIRETRMVLGRSFAGSVYLTRGVVSVTEREPHVKQRRNGACNGIGAQAGLVRCLALPCLVRTKGITA